MPTPVSVVLEMVTSARELLRMPGAAARVLQLASLRNRRPKVWGTMLLRSRMRSSERDEPCCEESSVPQGCLVSYAVAQRHEVLTAASDCTLMTE